MKTLKQFVEEASETYGEVRTDPSRYNDLKSPTRLPDWVRGMLQEAWKSGEKAEFDRLYKKWSKFNHMADILRTSQQIGLSVFGPEEKKPGQCEHHWCKKKATWDVCGKSGRSVHLCGRHKIGKGLTLDMRRIKVTK